MDELQDIGRLLADLSARLAPVSDTPRLDAELLLGQAIDMPRSYLYAHPEDQPDAAALERLERAVARRLDGEPMAYLTGVREFWSLPLLVTPATLVPRPETEILVELALAEIPRDADWPVLDLGTGSGAIALAVARERPACRVVATDRSTAALAVARENARALALPNLEFLAGDWTAPVRARRFRVVMSNPPYVQDDDPALGRLRHEPREALAAGPDGLDAIRSIAREAWPLLVAGGLLLVEHGALQESAVAAICRDHAYEAIHCTRDFAGLPRVTAARRAAR